MAKEPGHRGELGISRKPLRAGMPGKSGGPVVTTLVCFLHFAREAAGALGTRHSPRPLLGERDMHDSGASRRGMVDSYLVVIARSEATKQSTLLFCRAMDCFASLAMTFGVLAV